MLTRFALFAVITLTSTLIVVLSSPPQVVDLGCSECSLLKKLKFHREIELLVGVDINGAKVKRKMYVN